MSNEFSSSITNHYLFLDRLKRVLLALKREEFITKSIIQSNWILKIVANCFAREIKKKMIQKYNSKDFELLMITEILSKNLFDNNIVKIDLLLQINDKNVISLFKFEDFIDEIVESSITILIHRHRQNHKVVLDVENLFKLVSHRILEYASSLFENLRYEMTLKHNLSLQSVIVFETTNSFNFESFEIMITSLNNRLTLNLDVFIETVLEISNK